jgi:dipeptidyl aminopeptidase/acylaminoacyl peptidase
MNTTEGTSENKMPYQPTLRDMVMLETPMAVKVSPGGSRVAAGMRTTNWKENRYETICYVHDAANGAAYPLNRTGSVLQMEWVDDETLGLLRQDGDKEQVYLYEGLTGDGWAVTDHKTGVEWFKPFAGGILYKARNPERAENKPRADRFGKYTHLEQEESPSALYYVGLEELRQYEAQVKAMTEDEAKELVAPVIELSRLLEERLAIREVIPSPADDAIYLNTWKREDLVYMRDTRSYCIRLDARAALAEHLRREKAKKAEKKETGDKAKPEGTPEPESTPGPGGTAEGKEDLSYLGEITRLHVSRAGWVAGVAPDGRRLGVLYQGRDDKMYTRFDLWLIDTQTALNAPDADAFLAGMRNITEALDQELLEAHWVESGLYAACVEGTRMQVVRLEGDGRFERLDLQDVFAVPIWQCFHIATGGQIALIGANAQSVAEVYLAEPVGDGGQYQVRRLTELGQAVEGWELGTVETIRWTSRDGTEIEGVLRKPKDFDPTHKYPLVFVVHGGPAWFSPEYLLGGEERGYYPSVQFVNKGVLVLKPNYRGSAGRGQAFTELNVNNLGIGDLWDLESAIDHLAALGWVDAERVGCMGWSQGGYISAFVGLHSKAFRAASVGAGVSDWYTYHISNDIPDFTVDYLSGSPFRDRELYVKTAPISQIAQARTPLLIQHGAEDRRVPLSNAMELYRGLKEMGVPVELFVFPGMGHPITKPRENHAVMHQNLAWFSHYLLGEELKLE